MEVRRGGCRAHVALPEKSRGRGVPGGGFALGHAATGADFDAVSVNYGAVPGGDLSRVCPVVGSYGALDRMLVQQAARLVELLEKAGVEHDVKVYPGAGHSFMSRHDGWQEAIRRIPSPMAIGYDEAAAEDAWTRIFAFFDKHVA